MRTVKSLVTDTFIGEPEENLLKNVKDRGAEYYAEVQRRGKGHKLGSPHKYQVETLLNTIHSDARTAEEEEDIVLTASTEFSHVDQLGKLIPVLRMSVTYEKKSRMVIGYSHDAMKLGLHSVIRSVMERAKVEHKLGEAPQGNLERQVREHFQIGRQWEEEKE